MFEESTYEEEIKKIIRYTEKIIDPGEEKVFKKMTVVIADLVGSTSAKDSFGHSKGMNRCLLHNQIAAEIFKKFNGKVIKFIGDSILATFSESLDAVYASIMFRTVLERIKLPADELKVPLETRISITSGSVQELVSGLNYDIAGKVVDKAARLQKVADPGQILAEFSVVEKIEIMLKEKIPFIKIPEHHDICSLHLEGLREETRVIEITTSDKPFGNPPSERGHYISKLLDAISSCNLRILLSVRNMKSRKNRRDIGMLQDHLVEAQSRGVDVRILHNGWDADSLQTAAELESMGLVVKFCEKQLDSSVNIVDKNIVIFRSKKHDRFFSKNTYWKMHSYHVNTALSADFDKRWLEAITPRLQLADILNRNFKNCRFGIDRDEIEAYTHERFGIKKGAFLNSCLELLGFIRKIRYIFVLGKPGTGKSSIRKRLARDLKTQMGAKTNETDDYDRLKKMCEADLNNERFIPQDRGGFLVKDPTVLTDVLENISSDCLSSTDVHITWIIEFARDQYTKAFASFDKKVLDKAVVVHATCGKELMYKRLEERSNLGGASVSREVIEKFYSKDDAAVVCTKIRMPYIEVDNNAPLNDLNGKVENIIQWLRSISNSIYS
ncbi:MAG: hypothetical protein KAW12_05825 [Candidatus Aminicenantes bacterium]|nr:hypothetical protein [Candidatus Aminicenantes bacterium]